MSPAQIADEEIDHRTDIWSCGVVLYEFLTGKNPFKGANRQETFQAILSKDVPPCSTLNPEVPHDVDMILDKCMEKDPNMSYQSAADLRADLKQALRELDSSPSWSRSSSLFMPRSLGDKSWAAFMIPTAIVVLILAGIAYYFFNRGAARNGAIDWKSATSSQLTNNPGTEYFPSLSPDGKDIAYAAESDGSFDIFVQRVGGKRRENLTANSKADDTQPAFSPNGELIAFRSEREPKGIYTIEVSGDNLKHVSDFGFHPSWSPDGKSLVVSSFGRDQPTVRTSPGQNLSIIDIETGSRREILSAEATFPAWSPNGHRIAYWFHSGTFGRRDIATIPANGGEPVIVAKDFAVSNWNPVWSPDGKYLYFVSSRGGSMNFWRVAIDEESGAVSGDPEPIGAPSTYSRHLTFSRNGKRMAYVQTDNRSNIQGVNFDAHTLKTVGEPFWITEGTREISRAELSPDGTQFVMRLIRPTQDDLVISSRDGREWRDVTNDEPFDRYVRWSPDGKRLAFFSDRNGGGQVWISNADGTGLRQMTFDADPEYATGFPVWSPDGTRLIVYHNGVTSLLETSEENIGQVVSTLPAPNAERIVAWDWSPDGKKLAGVIAAGERRSIGFYSFDTNRYEAMVENNDEVPSWLPDSRHLIYADGRKIFMIDTETRQVHELLANPAVDIRSPFVSRDGKLLYYTAAKLESDIWMLDLSSEK